MLVGAGAEQRAELLVVEALKGGYVEGIEEAAEFGGVVDDCQEVVVQHDALRERNHVQFDVGGSFDSDAVVEKQVGAQDVVHNYVVHIQEVEQRASVHELVLVELLVGVDVLRLKDDLLVEIHIHQHVQ